jgi:hypothetical protein
MKKMSTLFVTTHTGDVTHITRNVRPENQWVLDGEGVATVKFDGTSCMIMNSVLFKRWDRKLSKKYFILAAKAKRNGLPFVAEEFMFKDLKSGAIACNASFDPITNHWPHWIPAEGKDSSYHIEGFDNLDNVKDGTYELVGPKLQGNPYNLSRHELWLHGSVKIKVSDFSFDSLKSIITSLDEEGLVFHHPDGRMLKLRRSDFNLAW